MCAMAAASFGYFLSSLFENETAATSLAPLVMMPMMLFGGLLTNNGKAPKWLAWMQYISPIKYCATALLQNEFRYDPNNLKETLTTFLAYDQDYWTCILIFVAMIIGMRIAGYFTFNALVSRF